MQFTIFQESRKGGRRSNQDRIAYSYSRDTLLLVVADGMGGHAGGDIAAQICVRLFIERFQREAKPVLKSPFRFLQESMLRAHEALESYASQFSLVETPRTTCVACVIQGGDAHWAHVGDSRLYLFRQGRLLAETKDHSKVQYLVDQGLIRPEEAATHPERNRVFSCLGGMVEPVIDLGPRTILVDGDLIVLCTDGFWGVIDKEEIAGLLASTPVLDASPALMNEAERRGGSDGDNLSTIIVRWGPELVLVEPSTTTTTTTDTMVLGEFATQLDRTLTLEETAADAREMTDADIERAIADIQSTIRRYRR